jgi:hypothetical protein
MSITTTINNIAFTFELDADEHWNIYAEHNFIEYVARDAKFTPLKTSTAAQIQELLKYDGQWEWFVAKNDKEVESRNIMLWWFVPLLDMKIIVQLEKKQTSIAEDVEVCFKMQEKQIAELQAEHKTELTKLRDKHRAELTKLRYEYVIKLDTLTGELNEYKLELAKLSKLRDEHTLLIDKLTDAHTKLTKSVNNNKSTLNILTRRNKQMVIHFKMQRGELIVSYEDRGASRAYYAFIEYILHMWIAASKLNQDKLIEHIVCLFKRSIVHNTRFYTDFGDYIKSFIKDQKTNIRFPSDIFDFILTINKDRSPFHYSIHNKTESDMSLKLNVNFYKHEYVNTNMISGSVDSKKFSHIIDTDSLNICITTPPYNGVAYMYSQLLVNIINCNMIQSIDKLYYTQHGDYGSGYQNKPYLGNASHLFAESTKITYIVIYKDRIMDE